MHWILRIGATFTNRFVIFWTIKRANTLIDALVNSIASRPQNLKPQVAGPGRICRGEANTEIAKWRLESSRGVQEKHSNLFLDRDLQKKIEFEFGPSTCKAPYRQLHESGEEPFASPLYISSMGISFSSTVLPSPLEYRRRETPDLPLLVTESRYPLRKRSLTSG